MKTQAWCCFVAGLLLLCGCAGSEPSISGNVNLDGKPVAEGDIRFIPMEGTKGPDAGAVIQEGKYKVVLKGVAGGKYRVSIRGYKQSGRSEPDPLGGPPVKGIVQIVPKEYHGEDSKLVQEITSGANRLDFDLVTSGAGK
jgi:hypothetical protein